MIAYVAPDILLRKYCYKPKKGEKMFEKVRKIIASQLKISEEQIRRESLIKADLGADSVDILQLLMTLEEEQGIEIPDEKLVNFEMVGDIADYLDSVCK